MRVLDITKELFSAAVYPGDPAPAPETLRKIEWGDDCNLSAFRACCHSATHIDAPLHYIPDGQTVDQIRPERLMGRCTVVQAKGLVTGADIDRLTPYCQKILLFRGGGKAWLTKSAGFALAQAGFRLVGTDASSIAPQEDELGAHQELLQAGIPILEGLDLAQAKPGEYMLIALPLLLGGAEAAPVRAVLLETGETP